MLDSSFLEPLFKTNSGRLTYFGFVVQQVGGIWEWMVLHQMWVFFATIGIIGLIVLHLKLKQRFRNIKKLWIFILFFLTKRQMLIPLIWTFAKREKVFDEAILHNLLQIRRDCRSTSLKDTPSQRLKLEQSVSHILYEYFTKLETENRIRKGSKFEKVVQDLEFIDAKLVELQALYNLEAEKWNNGTNFFVIKSLLKFQGMTQFDLFKS